MTPRTFWDRDDYLWEVAPDRADLVRSVWSHGLQEDLPLVGFLPTWCSVTEIESLCGPLVASC